jgi:hypothetical protein
MSLQVQLFAHVSMWEEDSVTKVQSFFSFNTEHLLSHRFSQGWGLRSGLSRWSWSESHLQSLSSRAEVISRFEDGESALQLPVLLGRRNSL